MADRSITLSLKADVDGFVNGMRTAKGAADKMASTTTKTAADSEAAARRISAAAAGVAKAQDRAKDAAGRLKVAQAQLDAARDSGNTVAVTRAEESLAKAQRDSESSAKQAAAAQGRYRKALQEAGTEVETLSQKVERQSQAMEQVGGALMGFGGVLALGFGKAVKTAADFDQGMSRVRAATHETDENMARLGEAAKKAGADTAFSAEEAAMGIEEMAKAGVSTEAILSGGLNGALALAAAGSMEVGDAAELAASAMTMFKLEGDKLPHVADLLAAGAGKAQGSVKDMGDALNQSGLVAAQSGLEIEETAGALAMFASNGLTGSDAGTSFKTMLQRLNPQTKAARELTEQLGISAYDAGGNFIGMEAYAGKLKGALAGMSEEQKSATLQTLFGSDAIRAAAVIAESGAEGMKEWTDKVNDSGYAAKTAGALQDNLAGDLEKLGGAFDTVFLKSGSAANEVLRDMTQGLEGFIDWVGTIPEPVLAIGGIFTGVAGGAALLTGAALTVIPKINDTRNALQELAPAGSKARGVLVGVGKAATIAGLAIAGAQIVGTIFSEEHVQSAESMEQALLRTAQAGDDVSAVALDEVFKQWSTVGGDSRVNVDGMADAIGQIADPSLGQGINENLNFMNGWFNLPDDEVTAMKDRVHDLSGQMGDLAKSGNTEAAAAGFRQLADEFGKHGKSAQDVFNEYPGYRDALMGLANDAGYAASEQELLEWALSGVEPAGLAAKRGAEGAAGGMAALGDEAQTAADKAKDAYDALVDTTGINPDGLDGMSEAMGILADESEEAGDKLEKVIDALFRSGMMHMSVQDAQAAMYEMTSNLNAAIEENGRTTDLATEAGRANVDALQEAATTGMDAARAYAEAGQSQGMVREALMGTYEELVRGYTAMGQSAEAADVLARQMMGIPEGVDIETSMDQQARIIAEATGQAIDAIPGYKGVELAVSDNGTAGSVQSKINAVTGKEEFVFVSDDGTASQVQQKIQNVNGVDRTVYVDDNGTVYGVQEDIDALTGTTEKITVTDEGTSGKVQQRINAVSGKTEYILTTDDGTIKTVQQRIDNVDGVERTVYVDDEGTVYQTQAEINDVDGKSVTIVAKAATRDALADIASAARDRTVRIFARFFGDSTQKATTYARTAMKDGGIARLPGHSEGGRLPYTGLGTDMILGLTSAGMPITRVDDGEWIINERSSRKHHRLLAAINADDPRLEGLPRFAAGGLFGGMARSGFDTRWQWEDSLVETLTTIESVVGELESWDIKESGEGWIRTMDGAVIGIADGAWTVAAATSGAADAMGASAAASRVAGALFQAAGGTAQLSAQLLTAAGGSANVAAGQFTTAAGTAQAASGRFALTGEQAGAAGVRFVGAGSQAVTAGTQFQQAGKLAVSVSAAMQQAAQGIKAAAQAAAAAKAAAAKAKTSTVSASSGKGTAKPGTSGSYAGKTSGSGETGVKYNKSLAGLNEYEVETIRMAEKGRAAGAAQGKNLAPWSSYIPTSGKTYHQSRFWEKQGLEWMRQLQKQYGEIYSGAILEDWSGRVFFKDGREISVDQGGVWEWVGKGHKEYQKRAYNGQLLRDFYPRVHLAAGGRLPRTGMGTDQILGMTRAGTPLAWLDDAEWVINQRSSQKYHRLLARVNADDPSVQHLAGHAAGARVGHSWSSYTPQPRVGVAAAPAAVLPQKVTLVVKDGPTLEAYVQRVGDERLAEHVAGMQQPMRQTVGTFR